jgi:DNA gyrase/topoisomerase IV subunit B
MNTSSISVLALIAYAVHEHQVGDGKRVRVHMKPRECIVEDDGRGMGLDREGYVSGLVEQLTERKSETVLHGLGLAVIAMGCPLLKVESHRNGRLHTQAFSWGRVLGPVDVRAGSGDFGTRVTLVLSPDAPPIEPQAIVSQLDHWRSSFPALALDVAVAA